MERPQAQPASPAVSDAYMIAMLLGISFCRWGVGKEGEINAGGHCIIHITTIRENPVKNDLATNPTTMHENLKIFIYR